MPQKIYGQQGGFVGDIQIQNQLRQNRARHILPCFGILNHKGFVLFHQNRQITQGDIAAFVCIVQTAVGIFFNDDGGFCHVL